MRADSFAEKSRSSAASDGFVDMENLGLLLALHCSLRRLRPCAQHLNGIFGIAQHAKFRHVQAFQFHFLADAHRAPRVHGFKNNKGCAESVNREQSSAAELHYELRPIAVKQAGYALAGFPEIRRCAHTIPADAVGTIGENSERDGAEPATISVNRNRSAGIIDLENSFIEQNAQTN